MRLLNIRLDEQKNDVKNAPKEQHSRNEKQSTTNKSVLTDHTTTENHLIDVEGVKVVYMESHRRRRLVKEVTWTRKTEAVINQDEGNYELPHVYDDVTRPVRHKY